MNEERRVQRWTDIGGLDTDFKSWKCVTRENFQSLAHLAFLLVLDFDFFQNMMCACVLLRQVRLFVSPWAVTQQALPSMEFSSRLPFLSPGDLPNPGIKAGSPALQAGSLE